MSNSPEFSEHSKTGSINVGGRAILAPESSITYENCQPLKSEFDDALKENKTEIILDCKQVSLVDSTALELLLQTHAELRSKGGALKIVGLNEVCRDILLVTRLINVLFVYKDIHEAITSIP